MFIEGENIILKEGGQYEVLAVSFEDMVVMVTSTNRKLGYKLESIDWSDIKVNDMRDTAIREYKRRRQIDKLLEE